MFLLNGPELVTLYKAACAGVDPEEIKPAEIRTTSKISVAPHLKPQKNSSNIFTYLLSFVLLVIIAAAGYIFLFSSSDQPENIVTPKQSALSDDTAKSNEKKPKNALNKRLLLKHRKRLLTISKYSRSKLFLIKTI